MSYKPTNQTEKWYGRHERRDNKTNAEAGIKNIRICAGPNSRDYWQSDHGLGNANALPNTEGDPPPLKWSDLRYVFDIQEDCNGKEAIQA